MLKRVPATHRHLIITLHVLFPGLVLPALDLLDRGLVGRVVLRGEGRGPTKDEEDGGVKMEGGLGEGLGNHIPDTETTEVIVKMEDDESTARTTAAVDGKKEEEDNPKPKPAPQQPSPAFYLVRSAQPSSRHRGRRRRGGHGSGGEGEEDVNGNNLFPGGQRGYIVRLDAWNCTCAAFSFAAFPVEGDGDGEEESKTDVGGDATGVEDGRMDVDVDLDVASHPDIDEIAAGRHDDGEQWKFGGMSLENSGSASAPLCKHLLACLLAERWQRALGQNVVERHVSKAEMAGIVAEI